MSATHAFELAVPVEPADHATGTPRAPVTLVEYGDFECPNCRQATAAIRLLLERFGDRVDFVYRHFPLEEVHPHALAAAEAAEAAGAQGRFWQMHDLLFDNQDHLKLPRLKDYAGRLQLDMARFTAEMDDHVHLQRIREQQEGGRRSGVHGTPGIFINGRIQDVSFGLRQLFDVVEALLAHR